MSPSSATSDAIGVLVVDSNRLQAQLLTSALRRHAEFHIATCSMDIASLLQAFAADPPERCPFVPKCFRGQRREYGGSAPLSSLSSSSL